MLDLTGAPSSQATPKMNNQIWSQINSKGFLAEVFHPWVRWEGPGSGFENSSGGGAGAGGASVWAQVGGPKLGPRGWAQAGPKWVGPSWAQVGQKSGFFQTSFFCGFLKK